MLVGAFERDNFGDLLFFHVTERFLSGAEVTAASMIGADMTATLGEKVQPFSHLLAAEHWDLVWCVGGEIGGLPVSGAMPMSLAGFEGEVYDRAPVKGQQLIARFLAGADSTEPAYIPSLENFPLNAETPLILNSIGIATLDSMSGTLVHERSIVALRSAAAVTVRDANSADFAHRNGFDATLVPDVVHAMPRLFPELTDRIAAFRSDSPYFLFQVSEGLAGHYPAADVAEPLAAVARETGFRPALFTAGRARHHDSASYYGQLAVELEGRLPGTNIEIIETRKAVELAARVAGAQLWIGTSLHGRIISASYDVPRISLRTPKTTAYAQTWDPGYPSDVLPDGVVEASRAALLAHNDPAERERSAQLVDLAYSSTASIVKELV
jgi:hypothetical protein